ncbi:ribonuclease E inhibitor RraB [Bacillaceae bacterium OS4b]|nr:ribonuclease E inhibitor RraB [Bacillaceae bacterium OS4b]
MKLFPEKFPNDEDGQVLKMLYKQGVDFKESQDVDFFVAVPDKKSGESVLNALRDAGLNCELEKDDETEDWTCYCFIKMFLNYEDIIDIQKRIDKLSKPYDGYTDGWGVMVD